LNLTGEVQLHRHVHMVGDLRGDQRARAQRRRIEGGSEHGDVFGVVEVVARLLGIAAQCELRRRAFGCGQRIFLRKALAFVDGRQFAGNGRHLRRVSPLDRCLVGRHPADQRQAAVVLQVMQPPLQRAGAIG
jgi:hypothetical protein